MVYFLAVLVLLIPILAIVLDSQIGRALAARLERRELSPPDSLVTDRIAFLEGEVDRLNSELIRLTEESEFMHRLLTEGSDDDAAVSDQVDSPPPEKPPGE